MAWLSLAGSMGVSVGGVCLVLACFHRFVLAPRWRRSMQALDRAMNGDCHAYDDVVPALKMAETKAGGGRRCTDRRKSFS